MIAACIGIAPGDVASSVSVFSPANRDGGVKVKLASAASIAAIEPLYDSDPVPSPVPVRPEMLARVSVPLATDNVTSQLASKGPSSGSCNAMPSPEAADKISG